MPVQTNSLVVRLLGFGLGRGKCLKIPIIGQLACERPFHLTVRAFTHSSQAPLQYLLTNNLVTEQTAEIYLFRYSLIFGRNVPALLNAKTAERKLIARESEQLNFFKFD